MDRKEWEHSTHTLRKLLHAFNEEDAFDRKVNYRFGLQFNPMFGFFHLWDGKEARGVATIRVKTHETITRYLPDWTFREQLFGFKMDDRESKFIPSVNVTRHNDWVHGRLQGRVERAMRERADFLALEARLSSGLIYRVTYPMSQGQSGRSLGRLSHTDGLEQTASYTQEVTTPTIATVLVEFTSQPTDRDKAEATMMIRFGLEEHEYSFRNDAVVPFADLVQHYNQAKRHQEMRKIEEAQYASFQPRESSSLWRTFQTYYGTQSENSTTAEFMGRPMEQIRQELMRHVQEGQRINEEDMMQAVRRLDEADVPREAQNSVWDRSAVERLVTEQPEARMSATTATEAGSALTEDALLQYISDRSSISPTARFYQEYGETVNIPQLEEIGPADV